MTTSYEDALKALASLRQQGWSVAVHNDYRLDGEARTFWLLTHPLGHWIKGEGRTDAEALEQATDALERLPSTPGERQDAARSAHARLLAEDGWRKSAYWTYDPEAHAYYFAPNARTSPPYKEQRHVTAILDVASDGTLAGVELVMGDLPPPPAASSPPSDGEGVKEATP